MPKMHISPARVPQRQAPCGYHAHLNTGSVEPSTGTAISTAATSEGRLYLLCTLRRLPVAFALTGAKADEREVLMSLMDGPAMPEGSERHVAGQGATQKPTCCRPRCQCSPCPGTRGCPRSTRSNSYSWEAWLLVSPAYDDRAQVGSSWLAGPLVRPSVDRRTTRAAVLYTCSTRLTSRSRPNTTTACRPAQMR